MNLSEIRLYYKDIVDRHNLSIDSSLSDESYISYALQLFWYNKFDVELLWDDDPTYKKIYDKEMWFQSIRQFNDKKCIDSLEMNRDYLTSRFDKIRFMDAKLIAYENLGLFEDAFYLGFDILKESSNANDVRYFDYCKVLADKVYTWGYQFNKLDDLYDYNKFHKTVLDKHNMPSSSLYYGNHFRILSRLRKFGKVLEEFKIFETDVDLESFSLKSQLNIYYSKATAEYYLEDYISCLWSFEKAFEISKKQRANEDGILTLSSLIDVALKANIPPDSGRVNGYKDKLLTMINFTGNSLPTVISAYSKLAILEYKKGNYSGATVFLDKGIQCYNENKDEHHLFYLIVNTVKYTPELPGMTKYIYDYLLDHDYNIKDGPLKEAYKEILYMVCDIFSDQNDLKGLDETMKKINAIH